MWIAEVQQERQDDQSQRRTDNKKRGVADQVDPTALLGGPIESDTPDPAPARCRRLWEGFFGLRPRLGRVCLPDLGFQGIGQALGRSSLCFGGPPLDRDAPQRRKSMVV